MHENFEFLFFWYKVWDLDRSLLHLLRCSMRSRWGLCSVSHWTWPASPLQKRNRALTPHCRQLRWKFSHPSLCWHLPSKCVTLTFTALLMLSECGSSAPCWTPLTLHEEREIECLPAPSLITSSTSLLVVGGVENLLPVVFHRHRERAAMLVGTSSASYYLI